MDANAARPVKMDTSTARPAPADASTARPNTLDPGTARRASMRSVQTLLTMPILHEDENAMPKLPLPTFDNTSRSSLSRPSSISPSFSRPSSVFSTVPPHEWTDEESRKKYLEQVRTYHRQRPTTVYSFALAAPKPLSDSSGEDSGIAMSDLKLEQNNAQAAVEEGRTMPDGKKKRDYFFTHFTWWRAMMMLLLMAAVGVGLGLGLHYGLMNNP